MEKYQATKKYFENGLQEATQQQDDILIKAFEERLKKLKVPTVFQNIKDATFLNQELLIMNTNHAKRIAAINTAATEAEQQVEKLTNDQKSILDKLEADYLENVKHHKEIYAEALKEASDKINLKQDLLD